MSIHPEAAGGFASAASTYARIRPTYARSAIGVLHDLGRDGDVLDVAAGTGILTGQLQRAGLTVTAVEPLVEMVEQLRRTLPQVPVALAAAEALPVGSNSVDMITVGQGFHWFDAPAALREASRVLRPGGTLALMWNVRDESVPWVRAITELVELRTGGRPYMDHREQPWADVIARDGHFDDVTIERTPNPVVTTVPGVLDRLRSTGFVATLATWPREDLIEEASRMLAAEDLPAIFEYPHDTVLYWCRRR